ncbi:MAG: class I SAM-dependent methyltransferase [Lentisphaeria bacterium]
MIESSNPFNDRSTSYDQWYDTPLGNAAFCQEIACLRLACPDFAGKWLEVGVGTGRFAKELGLANGLDPAPEMLRLAAARGIQTYHGRAEDMPFPNAAFDGVLLTFALCFFSDPTGALQECRRILQANGKLLLAFIPADSPWGQFYARKAAAGHPLYAKATFRNTADIITLVEKTGFALLNTASALLTPPEQTLNRNDKALPGINKKAGFVALCLGRGTGNCKL